MQLLHMYICIIRLLCHVMYELSVIKYIHLYIHYFYFQRAKSKYTKIKSQRHVPMTGAVICFTICRLNVHVGEYTASGETYYVDM